MIMPCNVESSISLIALELQFFIVIFREVAGALVTLGDLVVAGFFGVVTGLPVVSGCFGVFGCFAAENKVRNV